MDEDQIDTLREMLAAGRRIGWRDPSGPMREIVSIGLRGEEPKEPAGNFRCGQYCALWAACPEDIYEISSVFPDVPEQESIAIPAGLQPTFVQVDQEILRSSFDGLSAGLGYARETLSSINETTRTGEHAAKATRLEIRRMQATWEKLCELLGWKEKADEQETADR